METGTEAALPTPASTAAIGEVAETVTEAMVPAPASAAATEEVSETVTEAEDRSGPALATPERTAPRCRRCPPWPVTVTWAVSAVRGLLKENLRRKTLQQ